MATGFEGSNDAARCILVNEKSSCAEEEKLSKQLIKHVNVDSDILKFLGKRKKYSKELKDLLCHLGAELQIKPEYIIVKKVTESIIANWEKRCEDTVNKYSSCFQRECFPLDDAISRDLILGALPTLQKNVSSAGAACWLDTRKQNLILVSLKLELSNVVKQVEKFIRTVSFFAKKCFVIKESLVDLVRENLATLEKDLESCTVKLENRELVVVCVQDKVDIVVKSVKNFLESVESSFDAGIERTVEKSEEKNKNRIQNDVLLRAVNNPAFVPRNCKEQTSIVKSSFSASAVNAPEFVQGKGFGKYETRLRDSGRILWIIEFVNIKLKQLTEDPGLLDELSVFMANLLSAYITVEDEIRTVSNLLFQKCISEQNFQYAGSKLANYLDKYLVPKTTEKLSFRGEFLKRCKSENDRFKDIILTDHERACNVALLLGELLMNYKDINGQSIEKFLRVVSNIIKQFLACTHVPKLLICAGKLLKMTGSSLNPNDGLFVTVKELANSRHIDRTAQMLFSRVCELRATNWGQNEMLQTPTYTHPIPYGSQGCSIYIPNMDDHMLEEQAADLPVFGEGEWNEYATDNISQEENRDEALYTQSFLKHYGYLPYATTDDWRSDERDDYYDDFEKFLQGNNKIV